MKQLTEGEFKVKWIEALRSGKYKQGDYKLYKSNGTYCCMGVGCKILGAKKKDLIGIGYPSLTAFKLPGITNNDEKSISRLNDREKFTFEEISYFIENGY